MRITFIAAAALALIACGSIPVWAEAVQEQSEKCDDLQMRCLHRENAICEVYKEECSPQRRAQTSGGGHGPKKERPGRHRNHV